MILEIKKYPDITLKRKCKTVKKIDDEIKKLAADMLETMYAAPGVGLAANQVGVPVRLCVIDIRPDGKKNPLVLINPRIVSKKGRIFELEGCLSFPGLNEKVRRASEVKVEATDENGMPVAVYGKELLSRALQHELDHLGGKVFIDYLSFLKKLSIKGKIRKLKKEGIW